MNKKINILLTSSGGLTGTYLIKHYKSTNRNVNIIATDCNNLVPARIMADKFYVSPPSKDAREYISFLKAVIDKESIELIIPITSSEVDFFSKNIFLDNKIKIAITNKEDNQKLTNKLSMYDELSSIGINVPKVYNGNYNFPVFIKPIIGSGSKGAKIVTGLDELNKLDTKDCLCTEVILAKEYTVDCLFDGNGRCVGYNNRLRNKVVGGGAVVCENKFEPLLEETIAKISQNFLLFGPINFQYFKHRNKIVVFDFNTRFASGGLPLSVNVGFDIPNMLIEMLITGNCQKYLQKNDSDGRKMIRYYEEIFI